MPNSGPNLDGRYPSRENLKLNVSTLEKRLLGMAGELGSQSGQQVYSGLFACLARQVRTVMIPDLPLEAVAIAARLSFECFVILKWLGTDTLRAKRWQKKMLQDKKDMLKAFKKIHPKRLKKHPVLELELGLAALRGISLQGINPADVPLYQKCKTLRMKEQYNSLFSLYSELCHVSAITCSKNPPRAHYVEALQEMTLRFAEAAIGYFTTRPLPRSKATGAFIVSQDKL
jgi:hypothetical protein